MDINSNQAEIFIPFIGMMLLTLFVWVLMYVRRLTWIFGSKVNPKSIDTPEKASQLAPAPAANASNNFKNLFELPVLFYALCLYLSLTQQVDTWHIFCANAFFLLRVVHSGVQCTTNQVPLRFAAYAASSLALWIMVVRSALQLTS